MAHKVYMVDKDLSPFADRSLDTLESVVAEVHRHVISHLQSGRAEYVSATLKLWGISMEDKKLFNQEVSSGYFLEMYNRLPAIVLVKRYGIRWGWPT